MNTTLLLVSQLTQLTAQPIILAATTGAGIDSWVGKGVSLFIHVVGTLLIGFAAYKVAEKIGFVGAWKALLGCVGVVAAAIVVFNLPSMPDLLTGVGSDVNETVNKFDTAERAEPPAGG